MFVSVGAGPTDAKLSQLFVRWALSLASHRSYRDEYSRDYVKNIIGYPKDDPIYPDLAFSLQMGDLAPAAEVSKSRPIVAIGPIGYFKTDTWPENDATVYETYLTKMVLFVDWLIHKGYTILFIPGEAYYDQLAIHDMKARLNMGSQSSESNAIFEASIQTVSDLVSYPHHANFVVASRFHNILLSQILLKPVLALPYQAKIDSLMSATDQGDYCLPVGTFDLATLKQKFETLAENEGKTPQQPIPHVQRFQTALQQQYDHIFGIY